VQSKMQVMHLSGLGNDAAVRHCYADVARDNVAYVRAVAADMDRLFAAADLVICRGGGTTVAELMAVGRAAIIIPYPHHKDRQQLHNARVLESVGAALIQEERDLDQDALTQLVESLLSAPDRLRTMADQGRKLRRLDAVDAILEDVQQVLGGEHPVASSDEANSSRANSSRTNSSRANPSLANSSLANSSLANSSLARADVGSVNVTEANLAGPRPVGGERGAAPRRGGVA
jgi:hypothetical protein